MNKLPFSPNINNKALASVFNYTSATYKFYWFLGIIEEVENENKEIEKERIFARMIANAWYPIQYFKLSFGSQDKIAELIHDFHNSTSISVNDSKQKIYNSLIDNRDETIFKKLYHLDKNVPHKFLSPWYKGSSTNIRTASQVDSLNVIYQLYKNHIVINENWYEYLRLNAKILKEYTFWNLALFIQARNPLTPDVINKLIKPAKRNSLSYQRNNFWNIYLEEKKDVRCIFTDEALDKSDYHLDHFIPYSFVAHDLIWNLVPINSSFNNSKNNKLPILDEHFKKFFDIQNDALELLDKRLKKKFREEYITIFKSYKSSKDFNKKKLKETIEPLISVASNNGFEFLK